MADDDRLPIESYAALTSHRDPRRLFKVLDELGLSLALAVRELAVSLHEHGIVGAWLGG